MCCCLLCVVNRCWLLVFVVVNDCCRVLCIVGVAIVIVRCRVCWLVRDVH